MNKMIERRNLGSLTRMYDKDHRRHVGAARRYQHQLVLERWWKKSNGRDVGLWKFWARQEKKQFLLPGTNAYDKWVHRFEKRKALDPAIKLICGRHVLVPAGVCWSDDRKLRMSLVKANAQGRRRRG